MSIKLREWLKYAILKVAPKRSCASAQDGLGISLIFLQIVLLGRANYITPWRYVAPTHLVLYFINSINSAERILKRIRGARRKLWVDPTLPTSNKEAGQN